jgi:hypothetical protein
MEEQIESFHKVKEGIEMAQLINPEKCQYSRNKYSHKGPNTSRAVPGRRAWFDLATSLSNDFRHPAIVPAGVH